MNDRDWTFGNGSFAKIYGDRLAESSLMDCAVATRWVFVYMLARADSEGRFRCATVEGLARAAAVSLEDAQRAVAELEAPDPQSTSPDQEGRRVLRIAGGWQIVTYKKYRDYRTEKQKADAYRQQKHRKSKSRKAKCDVTACHSDIALDIRYQIPDTRQQSTDNGSIGAKAPHSGKPEPVKVTQAALDAEKLFAYWQAVMGKPKAVFTPKRRKAVLGMLKLYPLERLMKAVDGCKASAFHQGENEQRQVYDDLALICRDGEHVEQFESKGPPTAVQSMQAPWVRFGLEAGK